MDYRVRHVTTYEYDDSVTVGYNRAHLTPRTFRGQRCLATSLTVAPLASVFDEGQRDYFGNEYSYFSVQEPHDRMVVSVESEVSLHPALPPAPGATPPWETVRETLRSAHAGAALEAYEFVFESRHIPLSRDLAALAEPVFTPGRPILEGVMDLTTRIYSEFAYDPTATSISTPLAQVLEHRAGVCQDFAHLQIGSLRSIGLAARYVSGYVAPKSAFGHDLVGAQASHAWLSVFTPDYGWVDFDPTNNLMPADEHITLAWGRDYDEVCPLRGVILGGGEQRLAVDVEVVPLREPGTSS